MQFSQGYCSFDDPNTRGGYGNDLMDWAQNISLLPYPHGTFLYGPFNWKTTNKAHMIDKTEWAAALPRILNCKTTSGTMFTHGFGDAILRSVAKTGECFLKEDMIDDAKKDTPGDPLADCVPVWYSSIQFWRSKKFVRIVPMKNCTKKVESGKRPYLFRDMVSAKSKKKVSKRIGRYMDRESVQMQGMYDRKLASNR
jgi:hypothetical protein